MSQFYFKHTPMARIHAQDAATSNNRKTAQKNPIFVTVSQKKTQKRKTGTCTHLPKLSIPPRSFSIFASSWRLIISKIARPLSFSFRIFILLTEFLSKSILDHISLFFQMRKEIRASFQSFFGRFHLRFLHTMAIT